MIAFIVAHGSVILAALLAVSEVLALVPSVQANGIFDAIVKILKTLKAPAVSAPVGE